jgi:MoxR-like ATPase
MVEGTLSVEQRVAAFGESFSRLKTEILKQIVGYEELVEQMLTCLLCGGHALLEGVPGLGKTYMVRALASAVQASFARIQFTPDLMPADIIGTTIVVEAESGERAFTFQRGPVFNNIILADEINRATPKTQSALLEAMQEKSVSVGGITYRLEEPFFVAGTQNPIEMEGTYPLPEAQVDRFFFKLQVEYLGEDELAEIIERTTRAEEPLVEPVISPGEIIDMRRLVRQVEVADFIKRYAIKIVLATHPEKSESSDKIRKYIRYGASPRGVQALILGGKVQALLDGRLTVSTGDVRKVALAALRHRLLLNFEGEAEEISTDGILGEILSSVPEIEAR